MVDWQGVLGAQHDEALQSVESPNFDAVPNDWQRYVPDRLRNVWSDLPTDARLCVYVMAQAASDDVVNRWDD